MRKRANGEGLIYQRKQGQWVAAITLGSGKRKYFYCRNQAEAVFTLQHAQQARLLGTLTSTRNETLETFLLKWLQYEAQPKVRERTYQSYQQIVTRDLLPSLGRVALQKLTSWDIQDLYQQKRHQQAAPSTIYKIHRVLHHALNDAVKLVLCQCSDDRRRSGSAEGGSPLPGRGVSPHPLPPPAAAGGALV